MCGLQYIREHFNMSIATLSKQMGISYQAISQWEKGIRQIPAKRLNELAILFGIPEQYFLDVKESDIEELDTLIRTAKAQAEESYLFSEYENLLKAERQTISKIDRYLKGKDNEQETFEDLTNFMEKEIKRFEKLLDVLSNPDFRFLLDPILDVFISQGNAGANRIELIQSLRKEITAIFDDAEETVKTQKWKEGHKAEFDELF
ncbi:MAG TPA: hypothetical protein DCR07_04845 [Lactococcus sp.]|nr:hypothetical protein [Lactococcus sp.]